MKIFDTIAAIATPLGSGGIAIIRISGPDAEAAAQKIVRTKSGIPLEKLESHKLTLSDIHRPDNADAVTDEALVSVMRAPRSFTGETVVEINCHGGYFAASEILNYLFASGARLAEPGEFTRRAFLNGKTDMLGAEATMDIIDARSELGLSNAAKALGGALSRKINTLRGSIMEITANISAAADYPDEVEPLTAKETSERLAPVMSSIDELIGGFNKGRLMRDGITTVIAGKPNVGKSSLLNALARADRAIVTDIPGTTRDTIEEYISLRGASLRLLDTAGIRAEASDAVERIGIERAMENICIADLCLFVIDSSLELDDKDDDIAETLSGKPTVVILNKTDRPRKVTPAEVTARLGFEDIVETSAPPNGKPEGIAELEDLIARKFMLGDIKDSDVFISNARQRDSLIKAKHSLELAARGAADGMPSDLMYIDLEDALSALGEVVGETVQDEIIDEVFSRFCVGK